VDEIAWHTTSEKTTLLARNGSQWFYLIDPETGKVTEKFEPNFHETWDNDNKVFIELSDSSLKLCQSNPIIQQAYWHYVHNKHVHSIFDPFAHYEDENGNTRLRKTAYFRSIKSRDQSLIAYINKGEKYAYVKIYSMADHRHIQTINTGVPGNHDCKFFDGNQKMIVGSDDGIIRIFDITTGELVCKLKGHTDSVFCLDINSTETELISGSADGVWKLWSMKPGDDFGLCIHTSEQLLCCDRHRKNPNFSQGIAAFANQPLRQISTSFTSHWRANHFVVVDQLRRKVFLCGLREWQNAEMGLEDRKVSIPNQASQPST
jgi:WD40 repeat protein